MKRVALIPCALAISFASMHAFASQQKAAPEKPAPETKPAPSQPVVLAQREQGTVLRVHLVISRFKDDKKISSLPYDLSVTAMTRPGEIARLRIGGDVPYLTGPVAADGKTPEKPASYAFRTVGTTIECSAAIDEPGRFRLFVSVSDSSVSYLDSKDRGALPSVPRFPTFSVTNIPLLLRDGQTAHMTSATDPTTGELMRVDVTMTVVK